ncbi:hypothetical protein PINS_up018270 [Pythium insidiosum]|nr:hypothetical protein PINS_up018270 [Pythium insidiosum]
MGESTPLLSQASAAPDASLSLSGSAHWTARHRLKPPNYPSSASSSSSAVRRSPDYSTFRSSCASASSSFNSSTSSSRLGLSTRVARRRLLAAIERKLQEKERSPDFTHEFRDPFSWLLVLCAVFRFVDYGRQVPETTAPLLEGLFLVGAAVLNVVLNGQQRRRHHDEMVERVRVTVHAMTAEPAHDGDATHGAAAGAGAGAGASRNKPVVLTPSTSLIACYRDQQWQRLPMNLLVEGDVVALMSGDVAPGDVRPLDVHREASSSASGGATELVFARGTKLPASQSQHEPSLQHAARCNATFNAPLLLSLCGDMRVFEMLETPVVQDMEDAFFRIRRPPTFTQKLQAKARLLAVYVCTVYSVLVLLAIGLRVVVQHRSLHMTLNHVLLGPIGIWLCFASLNTPLALFLAEAVATASVLGSFETTLLASAGHSKSAPSSRPASSPRRPHASELFDSEERERLRSEHASRASAFRRSLAYFWVVLKFRAMPTRRAHAQRRGSLRHRLAVPFRSFRLVERLGSTTMLCCFDDDVLCDQTPSVEEIFLLSDRTNATSTAIPKQQQQQQQQRQQPQQAPSAPMDAQSNSGRSQSANVNANASAVTVLDLHPDRDGPTGLRFEDPKWRQHLPSLKPLGLAILLNDPQDPSEYHHSVMTYLTSEQESQPASTTTTDPVLATCLQRLSAHVRMLPFPTHLLALSHEMGFERGDLDAFRRLQALHVISPRLAHHEHTIDHHDQGQGGHAVPREPQDAPLLDRRARPAHAPIAAALARTPDDCARAVQRVLGRQVDLPAHERHAPHDPRHVPPVARRGPRLRRAQLRPRVAQGESALSARRDARARVPRRRRTERRRSADACTAASDGGRDAAPRQRRGQHRHGDDGSRGGPHGQLDRWRARWSFRTTCLAMYVPLYVSTS